MYSGHCLLSLMLRWGLGNATSGSAAAVASAPTFYIVQSTLHGLVEHAVSDLASAPQVWLLPKGKLPQKPMKHQNPACWVLLVLLIVSLILVCSSC